MRETEVLSTQNYRSELRRLVIPISLQCVLQSSFSVVDQLMIGQLGSVSVAAVGLSGKFISLLTVLIQAICTVAGIIIAQAVGKGDKKEISKGLCVNMTLAFGLTAVFMVCSLLLPRQIMGIYSEDSKTIAVAAAYLRVFAIGFLPMVATNLLSTFLRCMKETKIPLYAGFLSAVVNTILNYILIYGKLNLPQMGAVGAAWASVIAQVVSCIIIVGTFFAHYVCKKSISVNFYRSAKEWGVYAKILLPLFICEFAWVLGENVYGYIYGHMGTEACAAMTLINPIVSLMIGGLSGVAQAAGIMIGEFLGKGDEQNAYKLGKRLMKTGFLASATLSVLLLLVAPLYTQLFNVEESVREMTGAILVAFAIVCPIKVLNMILGGGVIRSGGKTNYVMMIDIIGTWGFGVPLGFFTAFFLKLPIAWVYFVLSLEELVRFGISLVLFRKKVWMQQL